MSTALVIQHNAGEGLGLLAGWLTEAGVALTYCRTFAGDPVPATLTHDGLIVLGGTQNAYGHDDGQDHEIALLAGTLAAAKPILAICLGAQLLAIAAGGTVAPNPKGLEAGHGLVRKADVAAQDPVFRSVPFLPDVIQWHCDEVRDLPPGAVALCRGEHTEHQAFRVGERAWGLQFHIECGADAVRQWATQAGIAEDAVLPLPADMDFERTWRPSVEAFARVLRGGFSGQLI